MPDDIETEVTDAIGGVQGGDERADPAAPTQVAPPQETPDAPAPDAGEIEWAGGVVRKPPALAG